MKKDYSNISERARNGRNGVQLVYVLDCIKNSSRAADENISFESDAAALKFFFDTFNEEFNHKYNKRRFPCLAERIGDYLRGLPSCFAVTYWNDEILKTGLIWGVIDSTDGKKAEKFLNNWFDMIGWRIIQAAEKCKLNPYKYAI